MDSLLYLFKYLYAYCTDFMINIANITGLSYYEVNFVIFIVVYPLLLIVSPIVYMIQKFRLQSIKKKTISITKK
jgi:cytochrome c oxidase subunit IV